jgi:hypothetical protein
MLHVRPMGCEPRNEPLAAPDRLTSIPGASPGNPLRIAAASPARLALSFSPPRVYPYGLRQFEGRRMERKKVNSSGIRSVGYDASAQTLEVELSDGSIWQYSGVPPEVQRRLMAAPSIVSYYRDNIEEDYSRRRVK